jgi:hypothetical protein
VVCRGERDADTTGGLGRRARHLGKLPIVAFYDSNEADTMSYVYLLRMLDSNHKWSSHDLIGCSYKIGRTNNIERRHQALGVKAPHPIEIIGYIETDQSIYVEAYLHKKLDNVRMRGEWFKLWEWHQDSIAWFFDNDWRNDRQIDAIFDYYYTYYQSAPPYTGNDVQFPTLFNRW